MKILIFTEGTILKHQSEEGINDYSSYIPIGSAVEKINAWKEQGAEINYLTSRTIKIEVEAIRSVLKKWEFPDTGNLFFRQNEENYKDVAENILPDILIEDDCESIGGEQEMTYTHLKSEVKLKVHLIAVKEFNGIDHLPSDLDILLLKS